MKHNNEQDEIGNCRRPTGRSMFTYRQQEIRCFFLLIRNHYQDILDEYSKPKGNLYPNIVFNTDRKKKDCEKMISYCNDGLEALIKHGVREIVNSMDKMTARFTSIIRYTGSSPFELPNLMELRATRFYTQTLRRQLSKTLEKQDF